MQAIKRIADRRATDLRYSEPRNARVDRFREMLTIAGEMGSKQMQNCRVERTPEWKALNLESVGVRFHSFRI